MALPIGERVARLEERVSELRADVTQLQREIDGPLPGHRQPIRDRLHSLEKTAEAAAKLAKHANETRTARFKRWHLWVAIAGATWAIVMPTLNLFLNLDGG